MALKRWLYQGGRPNRIARFLNAVWALIHATGIFPNYLVTLEVIGRQSGKPIRFPLVMLQMHGERYLVSMLGEEAQWVRNLKAAGGTARLIHGNTEQVCLEDVDMAQRAAILKAYLRIAPGARPHIPVHKDAPVQEFEAIVTQYPMFRVLRNET